MRLNGFFVGSLGGSQAEFIVLLYRTRPEAFHLFPLRVIESLANLFAFFAFFRPPLPPVSLLVPDNEFDTLASAGRSSPQLNFRMKKDTSRRGTSLANFDFAGTRLLAHGTSQNLRSASTACIVRGLYARASDPLFKNRLVIALRFRNVSRIVV
jgi:hypothetical protein